MFKKNWQTSHSIQFTLRNLFCKINIYWFLVIFVKCAKHLDYVVTFPSLLLFLLSSALHFTFNKMWIFYLKCYSNDIHLKWKLTTSTLNVPWEEFPAILWFFELWAILFKSWLSFLFSPSSTLKNVEIFYLKFYSNDTHLKLKLMTSRLNVPWGEISVILLFFEL